ncbi:hypothetical protein NON20_15110 [Synechocystis sp. B12]|nr:hypothetical protein NON20_15110 [Synechocystis sp. B12]
MKSALKTDPKNAQAHCLLGMAYLKNNMMTMAKVHIGSAVKLDPNDPKVMAAKKNWPSTPVPAVVRGSQVQPRGIFGRVIRGQKK